MRRNSLRKLAGLGLALVLPLLGAAAPAQAPEQTPKQAPAKAPEKKAEEKTTAAEPPLVRTDLLKAVSGEHVVPLRDIFRPKFVAVPQAPIRQPGRPAGGPAAKPAEAAPAFTLTLSYLGPVSGGGKTLALVTVNGQTLPVGVGDEVAPGYKVLRITTDAIVVEGPNAETKTFTR
jgi:hypothetical protein